MKISLRGAGKVRGIFNVLKNSGNELTREVRQRLNNPSGESKPAFLVGCGRSGTSMLVHQLNKSWRVELYNEDNPAAFEKWRLKELSVIDDLIGDSYAPLILFKPILNTYQTPQLMARYPDAKFIFTFRHYDDVINSSLKRFGRTNRINHINSWVEDDFGEFGYAPPPEKTKSLIRGLWKPNLTMEDGGALYWLFYNQLYYDLKLDESSRVMLIRYESVVSDPQKYFQGLCDFLRLPYEDYLVDGIFASSVGREAPPAIEANIKAACDALWQRLSNDAAVRSIGGTGA